MKGIIEEFKAFVMRGNVVDLAVGVVIGTAFGKIVSSLVEDIMMPIISIVTGGVDITSLAFRMPGALEGSAAIAYGNFFQSVIDFIIIAAAIFVAIKILNKLRRTEEKETPSAPPQKSAEALLLTEIRDLLSRR